MNHDQLQSVVARIEQVLNAEKKDFPGFMEAVHYEKLSYFLQILQANGTLVESEWEALTAQEKTLVRKILEVFENRLPASFEEAFDIAFFRAYPAQPPDAADQPLLDEIR